MEEDVESLLHLHKQKTAFARMVSWEIGKEETKKLAKSKKKKNTAVPINVSGSGDSDLDDTEVDNTDEEEEEEKEEGLEEKEDSSEYEYYSAEDESECTQDSRILESADTVDGNCAMVEANDDSDDNTSRQMYISKNPSAVKGARPKAPSKKQKRRNRERRKEFAEFALPFRNVENLDFESLRLDDHEYQFVVRKKVPSLVELSMKTLWNVEHVKEGVHVPIPVKHGLSVWEAKQQQASSQLSWLYRLVGVTEKEHESYLEYKSEDDRGRTDGVRVVNLAFRNVWSCGYESSKFILGDLGYTGTQSSSWLPYCYLAETDYGFNYGLTRSWRFPLGLLSVLSSILDLMLPQSTICKHVSAGSVDSQNIDGHIKRIERSLSQRYPIVVKKTYNAFKEAAAYALWARGNPRMAIEKFLDLAKDDSGFKQACYLSEAARVCMYMGDAENARDLFMDAADAVIGKLTGNRQYIAEVTTQRFLLMADVYDQGEMTAEKSKLASQAWTTALKYTEIFPVYSCLRAVESFFCFHSGSNGGATTKCHLEEGLLLIQSLTERCPHLLHHQAIIQAWLGQRSDSQMSLRQFLVGTGGMIDYGRQASPLESLSANVDDRRAIPQPLHVVWRTQLGHMRIVTGHMCYEGDFPSKSNLRLHLTADGCLSCDLQMALPPIRALNLDPYTGLLVFKPMSSISQIWHSINKDKDVYSSPFHNGKFLVPTLVELYRDERGNMVHFHCKDPSVVDDSEQSLRELTLFWTGASGNKARLNLFTLLRKAFRDFQLSEIKSKLDPRITTGVGSQEWVAWTLKALDHCYKRGCEMTDSNLKQVVKKMKKVQKQEAKMKKETHKSVNQRRKERDALKEAKLRLHGRYLPKFGVNIIDYFTYDENLFILSSQRTCGNMKCFVTIDCSNQTTFMEPNIRVVCEPIDRKSYEEGETICHHRDHSIPHGHIMWIEATSAKQDARLCHVFGKSGSIISDIHIDHTHGSKTFPTPLIHGSRLYGISSDKKSVLCDLLEGDGLIQGPEVPSEILKLLILPNHLLVHSTDGLHLVDPATLHLLPITVKVKEPSLSVSSDGRTLESRALQTVEIIGKKTIADADGNKTFVTAVGAYKHLLLLCSAQEIYVDVCKLVAGQPKEICFINRNVGFLVSVSLQQPDHVNYRECLYHYNYHGDILGVLPFLGPGPRNMFPAHLPGSQEPASHDQSPRQPGWYIFLRDGHEGIMGIRLCDGRLDGSLSS